MGDHVVHRDERNRHALAGWLGSRFGLRRVLAVSVLGFTLGSVLCGIATGLDEIVAFRALQGCSVRHWCRSPRWRSCANFRANSTVA
jgi:hypothetical protein